MYIELYRDYLLIYRVILPRALGILCDVKGVDC